MLTLTRKEFPNVTCTREYLDALTDLWLAWHEQARGKWMRPVRGYHAISVQLWGFPRYDREWLRQQFQQNLCSVEAIKPVFGERLLLSPGQRLPSPLALWSTDRSDVIVIRHRYLLQVARLGVDIQVQNRLNNAGMTAILGLSYQEFPYDCDD